MDVILDRLTSHPIATAVSCIVLYTALTRLTAPTLVPKTLPWVGKRSNRLFAETWATFESFANVPIWMGEGYNKYSKKGKTYVMPDFSGRPEVIVPRSQLPWLLEQPDNVLSTSAAHYEALEGAYAFTHPQILKDPYHEHVVHKYLPRNINKIVAEIQEEAEHAIVESWGVETKEWKQLTVWDNLMFIISHITNRVFVGLPLCRNQDYLENMGKFAIDVITSSALLGFFPHWLKPLVGPIITIPNRRHWSATKKYTFPLIEERKANMKKKREDPTFEWEEPNGYLTWHIALATAENRQDELETHMISRRLMPINFAALHTTNLTATNTLFDLLKSDPSKGVIEGIREEAERVYKEEGGQWTKAGLQKLHRADSAIRESMRVNNFMSRSVTRLVLSENGITNEKEGWHAPKGAYIGTDMHNTMHDPEIYPNPNEYDAFRFSRPKEQEAIGHSSEKAGSQTNNVDLINTSDTFLPFSHGRHACPGRFFVSMELKVMLAYMFMNYDVECVKVHAENKWMNTIRAPDVKGTIRVRRKEGTLKA